jgi:hypothetical protein
LAGNWKDVVVASLKIITIPGIGLEVLRKPKEQREYEGVDVKLRILKLGIK